MTMRGTTPFTCISCTRRLLERQHRLAHHELKFSSHPAPPHTSQRALYSSSTNDAALTRGAPKAVSVPSNNRSDLYSRPNEPHYHLDTLPPTNAQLNYAATFFTKSKPRFLFSCSSFRQFPSSSTPEVAFLGRSNTGKSSLLNALYGRKSVGGAEKQSGTAKTSSKPGKTRTMNVFLVGEEGAVAGGIKPAPVDPQGSKIRGAEGERWIGPGRAVAVVDMPGHGYGSREEWGAEIVKYLTRRTQLRRAFLIVDAEHGMKRTDEQVLRLLREGGVPHQVILGKVDKILFPRSRRPGKDDLKRKLNDLKNRQESVMKEVRPSARGEIAGQPALGEVLAVSSEKSLAEEGRAQSKIGIDGVRWAILQAAGLETF